MSQTRLNSTSVISVSRDLIKNYSGFSNEVMKIFIKKKERTMHFYYKDKKKPFEFSCNMNIFCFMYVLIFANYYFSVDCLEYF